MGFFIVHHQKLDNWQPLALNCTVEEAEEVFLVYKKNGCDRYLEVSEEIYQTLNHDREFTKTEEKKQG